MSTGAGWAPAVDIVTGRRERSWLRVASGGLLALVVACTAEAPPENVSHVAVPLEHEGSIACAIRDEPPPPPLGVSVVTAQQPDGTIRIGPEGSLTLRIAGGAEGTLRVGVNFTIRDGQGRWAVERQLGADGSVDLEVPYRAIALPVRASDFSGYATIDAVLDPAGEPRRTGALGLWVHADERGRWVFYDDAVRDRVFDGGRLSELARSEALRDLLATTAFVSEDETVENPEETEAGDHDL